MSLEERLNLLPKAESVLSEEHYQLYLAQCLERRLVNEGYLTSTHPGEFRIGRLFYPPDDIVSYKEVAEVTGKDKDKLFLFARLHHLQARKNITVANALKSGLYPLKADHGNAFTDEEMAERIYCTTVEEMREITNSGHFEKRKGGRTKRARQIQVYFEAFELVVEAVRRGESLQGKTPAQVGEILQLDPLNISKKPKRGYHPEALVSDLWIVYRLGASPLDPHEINRYRETLFRRPELQPVRTFKGHKEYRVGDFRDDDFALWNRKAEEVLTNPYLEIRNPLELIGVSHVTRELGIGATQAKRKLNQTKALYTTGKRGVRLYRRAGVHELLGLPGTLLLIPEQARQYAEELIRRRYNVKELNKEYWGEDIKTLAAITEAEAGTDPEKISAFVENCLFSKK